MNKKKILLAVLYTLSLAAILYHPVNKIISIEMPSSLPLEVKFKATVFDPYDPMRGRYVRLKVMPDRINTADKKSRFHYREKGYAVIEKDKNGFARILRLEKELSGLKAGEAAVKVKSIWYHPKYKNQQPHYTFTWPFDRFYLNELKAPELEAELQNRSAPMVLKVKIFPNGSFAVSGIAGK